MIERQRFGHFSANREGPGIGTQAAGIGRGVSFIKTKFIEVVIAGDFIFRRQGERALPLRGFIKRQRFTCRGRRAVVTFKPVQEIGPRRGGKRKGRCGDPE